MKQSNLLFLAVAAVLAAGVATAAPATGAHKHAKIDTNNDGLIDRAEAAARPGLAKRFDKLDTNHDGRIDQSERPRHAGKGGRMARLDADHDGRLSRAEAGNSPMARKFDRIDANHDGFVTRDETHAAFKRMRAEHENGVGSGGTGRHR